MQVYLLIYTLSPAGTFRSLVFMMLHTVLLSILVCPLSAEGYLILFFAELALMHHLDNQ
jgi:hypothetical protein